MSETSFSVWMNADDCAKAIRKYLIARRHKANSKRIEKIKELLSPKEEKFLCFFNRKIKPQCSSVKEAIKYMKSTPECEYYIFASTIWDSYNVSGSLWANEAKKLLEVIDSGFIKNEVRLNSDLSFIATWAEK